MTAPTPAVPVFSDGTTLTNTQLADMPQCVSDAIFWMQGGPLRAVKPFALAYTSTAIAIPNVTDTIVYFSNVIANTDNIWVGSLKQFVINTAGWYRISVQLHYSNEPNGYRSGRILINGTNAVTNSVSSDVRGPSTINEGCVLFTSTVEHLAQGATVFASTWHSQGATLNLRQDFSSSFMSAEWLAAY